jgi:DHA1 family inner membrane transport protein
VGVLVAVQVGMALWGGNGVLTIALLVVLGAAGLIVNPVLVALVVRATHGENTLAVALSTSAFNLGIALGSALGGAALAGALGAQGPPIVGAALTALALLPLAALAWAGRQRMPRVVAGPAELGSLAAAEEHRPSRAHPQRDAQASTPREATDS